MKLALSVFIANLNELETDCGAATLWFLDIDSQF
jgi:hypothetical protein